MKSGGAWDLNAFEVLDVCDAGYKRQAHINGHF